MRRYAEVWRLPSAPVLILAGLVGRLPVGIVGLALVLLVHSRTGSYAAAGITTALYALATAAVAPLLGRLADRRGIRPVLLATGIAYPLALGGLLAALVYAAPLGLVYATAALAGAAFPLLSSSLRTLWNDLAKDDGVRQTAFALDSITMEAVWITGPLVVSLVVVVASPALAILGAAVLSLVGSIVVAASGPARRLEAHPRRAGVARRSPLRAAGMVQVLAAVGAVLFGFGALEVAIPAYANSHGGNSTAGLLLTIWAVGSAVGGIWFGTKRFRMPLMGQFRWTLVALAVGMAPLALAGNPWVLAAMLFLAGTGIAPAFTVTNGLIANLAPVGTLTEAFTWTTTVVFTANALGAATAGVIIDHRGGVPGALALAPLAALLAWAIVTVPGVWSDRRAPVTDAPLPEGGR